MMSKTLSITRYSMKKQVDIVVAWLIEFSSNLCIDKAGVTSESSMNLPLCLLGLVVAHSTSVFFPGV